MPQVPSSVLDPLFPVGNALFLLPLLSFCGGMHPPKAFWGKECINKLPKPWMMENILVIWGMNLREKIMFFRISKIPFHCPLLQVFCGEIQTHPDPLRATWIVTFSPDRQKHFCSVPSVQKVHNDVFVYLNLHAPHSEKLSNMESHVFPFEIFSELFYWWFYPSMFLLFSRPETLIIQMLDTSECIIHQNNIIQILDTFSDFLVYTTYFYLFLFPTPFRLVLFLYDFRFCNRISVTYSLFFSFFPCFFFFS